MQHNIQLEEISKTFGPHAPDMTRAIESCVHCGFCLATCPTYQVMGEEMDSPRGRILLMKNALENTLTIEETVPFIDRCLGCMACVTTCPSGVRYEELLFPYRNEIRKQNHKGFMAKVQRKLVVETLPYPGRFRLAASMGKLAKPMAGMLPKEIQGMMALLPEELPANKPLPAVTPAEGTRRARVALLAGCVQQVLDQEINWATLRVLARNGVEVVIPQDQACCGAVLRHSGEEKGALRLARQNLKALKGEYDAVVTNAAGCGSGLKEYAQMFKGLPEEEEAREFVQHVKDISVFLAELGCETPPSWPKPLKVAYHDACHLAHAQGVTEPPRRLLLSVPNISLMAIAQSELCCGSAGTYNIEHPDLADEIGQLKIENILRSGCEVIVTGNIGCMVQLRNQLRRVGSDIPVYHTIQFLDMAYQQPAMAH
jgi:glycolate oxidase iron-sulfur subunit